MNRAYSLLEIKQIDDLGDKRVIEGIASTPEGDRMGDTIDPKGISYVLPLPLLFQHNSSQPIGNVIAAKVSKAGMTIKAQIAPAGVAEFIDQAWALIKAGLIRGLSIGFRPLERSDNNETGGYNFLKTELLEISAVTVPANASATILTVKSIDSQALAALGKERTSVSLDPTSTPARVRASSKSKTLAKKTIAEQIVDFEAKRAASQARMTEIMEKSFDEGRTLETAEQEEYDGLETELKSIDEHIVRLKKHEAVMIAKATPVVIPATSPNPQRDGQQIRRSEPITVKSNAPQGILPARMAIAMYKGGNVPEVAAQVAKRLWPDAPEVELTLRTIVEAGDTTTSGWASQLIPAAQQMMNEFLEMLRATTIMGRIPGLRRVPFNIAVPVQTGSGSYTWVGEAAPKPVTSLTFSSVTLRWAKAAGIIVITEELARFSNPSAEVIIRDDMIQGLTRFFDTQFVGTGAEVSNVSPAGILNGISATSTTGTSAATFRTDMATLINKFNTNNVDPSTIVLLMSATQATNLSLMITDLGVPLFPNITPMGGTILGMPVIVSQNVGTKIIALSARDILLAEDDGIRVDISREATVEMETAPAVGEQSPPSTQSVLKSLWQNNLVGFRVERYITWKRGRDAAVEYLNNVAYVA